MYGARANGVCRHMTATLGWIANYVNPIIGQLQLQEFNARAANKYIQVLRKTPPISTKWRKPKGEVRSSSKPSAALWCLLRCAFKQAVRWEVIGKNPFDADYPQAQVQEARDLDSRSHQPSANACTDTKVPHLAMNLSLLCSCRIGEILGLTWNDVHIKDEDIANDDAHIVITQELERCSKRSIELLGEKDILQCLTPQRNTSSTACPQTPQD